MPNTPAPGRTKAYLNHATRFACLWNRRRSFISTSIILSVAQRVETRYRWRGRNLWRDPNETRADAEKRKLGARDRADAYSYRFQTEIPRSKMFQGL